MESDKITLLVTTVLATLAGVVALFLVTFATAAVVNLMLPPIFLSL